LPVTNGSEDQKGGKGRRRRHKVIIHTSPFLRCVQTSVAISAGLSQNPGHHRPSSRSHASKSSHSHPSRNASPAASTSSPKLAPIPEPSSVKANSKPNEQPENIKTSTIRVDAFLGEWLSPDYFEYITPPPSSIMMVAGAKADLLRREDYSNLTYARDLPAHQPRGFPGGWQSPTMHHEKEEDEGPLSNLSSLAQSLPRRDRTNSLSSVGASGSRNRGKSPNNLTISASTEHGIYQPPIPIYPISNSEPIPPGFVAHARDACVDVDYQWDSMREPQHWGNGGEYGEEWSSMHKRFRKGLQDMVTWYKETDNPDRLSTKTSASSERNSTESEGSEDEDTDLVIILVTHGAGCNALIGALTNQPVLLDVGMASLTMAVRKPIPVGTPTSSPGATPDSRSRANSRNLSVSDEYEVKLVANTEHLRTMSTAMPSSSRAASASALPPFRERFNPVAASMDGTSFGKPGRSVATGDNFGGLRRTSSVATSRPRSYVSNKKSSMGLWSAPSAQEEETGDAEDQMILNFGDENAVSSPIEREKKAIAIENRKEEEDQVAPLGLWGSPRPPGEAEKMREAGHKRRWTVTERGQA